ncbi:glycosyltransferase family 2 protein [uncultured Lamprocystis sp.]|jgi:glycosyltransferase involved in cell wall biosynthesis|uniref:glycosyltransferase family 2 protein n=1 Tax=uncultured Lamprocystis sp. TaxID=543132 RepID=UPI0025D80F5B|nr:glycosyltransferase family 2 protein [uncultured Lamprocystis sp.]
MRTSWVPRETPTISVVTVTLNARETIRKTLDSVLAQADVVVEYVVIDGGSTDGTREIIRHYAPRLFKWVSEPDQGISDAMNKGLAFCNGDYILFLHSDDYLVNEHTLAQALDAMRRVHADIYAFDIYFGSAAAFSRLSPRGFSWRMRFKPGIYHQGALCHRSLFDRLGGFDTTLAITMDYEFFLRAYDIGAQVHCIQLPLSMMRDTGVSSRRDWPALKRRFLEERQIHQRRRTTAAMRFIYAIYWPLYLSYRRLRALRGPVASGHSGPP